MSDPKQAPSASASQSSSPQASIDNLRPWEINFKDIKDADQKKAVEIIVSKWTEQLKKDLDRVLTENGITVYELGFVHPGSKGTMLISNGPLFDTAKVSVAITRELRGRVAEQLNMEP